MAAHPPDVLQVVDAAYRQHYEVAPARATISFVGVEPIEVLRFGGGRCDHYLSLGMSRYPMVDPAAMVVDDASAPRAELSIAAVGRPDGLWRQLAVLAAGPAVEGAVYEIGNRVDLAEPLCAGSRCTGGVLSASAIPAIAVEGVADVVVLTVLPATQTELAWARIHGSEALQQRWTDKGIDLADLLRDPVSLV